MFLNSYLYFVQLGLNTYSVANSQEKLGKNLDELCIIKLDYSLHEAAGITTKIAESDYFLN